MGQDYHLWDCPRRTYPMGAHNGHGRYEYIPVSSMEKIVSVIVKISELCAKI